jgi:hypothetical protein
MRRLRNERNVLRKKIRNIHWYCESVREKGNNMRTYAHKLVQRKRESKVVK